MIDIRTKNKRLNSVLDLLSQVRYTLDTDLPPQSVTIAWENLYALVYLEMKRVQADMESETINS